MEKIKNKIHARGGIYNDLDIFTYSFPCQDISNQGKQLGFEENSETRSSLLWQIKRILDELKKNKYKLPKYLLLENVKNFLSIKYKNQYDLWWKTLRDFGYESKVYLLNASNFGSCQNRERVFILSVRKDFQKEVGFQFSNLEDISTKKVSLKSIVDLNDNKYDQSFNKYKLIKKSLTRNNIQKYELENYSKFSSENHIYDVNYSGPTLTASGAMSRIKLYFGNNKIRTMNALEAFKYMGFKKQDYLNVKNTNLIPESKLIYLCGNSIVVNVLEAIFKTLKF